MEIIYIEIVSMCGFQKDFSGSDKELIEIQKSIFRIRRRYYNNKVSERRRLKYTIVLKLA